MPHITLAQWDINERILSKIVGKWARRDLELDIKVDNLAIIYDDGKRQSIRSKFDFE
jgi:hypothetical protein